MVCGVGADPVFTMCQVFIDPRISLVEVLSRLELLEFEMGQFSFGIWINSRLAATVNHRNSVKSP